MLPDAPATVFSRAFLSALISAGVRDIVLCPGSRSQALALAAAEEEAAERVRLWVRIDERSAGFLALGLAAETGLPVPVIVTSGTAAANLHPAVLEAHHSGIPLLLLTADRPDELRGIRANQTTDQPHLYGEAARLSLDIEAPAADVDEIARAREYAGRALTAALGGPGAARRPGPVQLNIAFRAPLSSAGPASPSPRESAEEALLAPVFPEPAPREPRVLERGPRTVVIAGNGAGPDAEELAHRGGWPLIAEISSGSRYGRNLVVPYREMLADPEFGGLVERVVVFGQPTLSREVPALLARAGVQAIVVQPGEGESYDPGHNAEVAASCVVAEGTADRAWLAHWIVTARELIRERSIDTAPDLEAAHSHDPATRLAYVRGEFAAVRAPIDRRVLVEALWRATWPHDRLVFGASRLIRVADEFLTGKKVSVFANRGLAGIDGTVATATGIALASQADNPTGVTRVLLGDLTLLHDVGSLLRVDGESAPRLQVIVGNDGGGTIFDGLEVSDSAPAALAERVLFTPQSVNLESLAAAYGWEYRRVATRADLDQALTAPTLGPVLIEAPLPR